VVDWLRDGGGAITVTIHLQPGAKANEIAGRHGDALKVRITAPPVDGRANAALVDFLAQRLGLSRSAVELKSGLTSRRKVLRISGASAESVLCLLAE
jgi:uncharacterized protein (TIGR00251 family)